VEKKVAPGVSTHELDMYAREVIKSLGDEPAFLDYQPEGARFPFPAALCTSVNDEVVHGMPKEDVILKEGDIISIDLGLIHEGVIADHAMTVAVGKVDQKVKELLRATKESLDFGIKAIKPGAHVGDIGYAIESYIKPKGYGIVRELAGHGVGREIHEDPYVPNYGTKGTGALLKPGMVIAIEPMINLGSRGVIFEKDGYTVRTKDGSPSAHFEHTVLITEKGAEVLTKI
jgi:methionyl aminopeptidase